MNNNQKRDSIYNNYQTNNQSLNKQENEPYRTEKATIGKRISRVVMIISFIAIVVLVGGFALVYTGVIKVNHVGPQSILLNASNIGVKKGKDYQYDYQVYPETSTAKNVYYESSDPSVAEVNRTTGYVTPIKEGTTTISIKSTDDDTVIEKSNLSVTNEKVSINDIKLSSERIVFDLSNKSKSQLLKVFTEPYNATNQELSFESSDSSVAIVDQSGRVYPVGFGMATIVVRAKDGNASATCEVIVTDSKNKKVYFELPDKSKLVFPYSIELETNYLKLRYGTSRKVGFILLPPDVTEDVVTWISSDPNVATVKEGLIEGVAVGHTTITARTVNDLVATLTVDVTDEETTSSYVEFRDDTDKIEVGETKRLTVSYDPNASVANFEFTSSNPDVISVDSEGNVTALSKGSATITVKPGSTSGVSPMASTNGDTIVIIADGIETPNYITVTESSITLGTGETRQLEVKSDTGNDNFNYQSLNEEVATVNEDGAIYGVSVGTAEIKISAANGVSTSVIVNVANVEASNIVISEPSGTTIKKGETLDLTAEIWPKNATEKKISWTSSNPNVATVNENGTVKAVAIGQTTITAVVGTQSNSIVIKVAAEAVDNSNLKTSKTLSDIQIEQLKKTPIIFKREGDTQVQITLDLDSKGYTDYINLKKTTFKIVSTEVDKTVKSLKIKDIKQMPLSKKLTFADDSYGKIVIQATVYSLDNKQTITIEPSEYTIGEEKTVGINVPLGEIVSVGSYFTETEALNVTDWVNTNPAIASINNGYIEGLQVGTTYVTGHSKGYTFIGTITVTDDSEEEKGTDNFSFIYDKCYAASDLCSVGTLDSKGTTIPINKNKCTAEKPYYIDKQKTQYKFVCKVDKKKIVYSGISTYSVIDKELEFDRASASSSVSKGEKITIKIVNWDKLNLASATVKDSLNSTNTTIKKASFSITIPTKTDAKSVTLNVEAKTSGKNPKVYSGNLVVNISEAFVPGTIDCEPMTLQEGKEKTLSCSLVDKYDTSIRQPLTEADSPTYKSSKSKIAQVSETGLVKGLAKGESVITVSAHNLKTKVKVNVEKAPPVFKNLDITLKKGKNNVTTILLGDENLTLNYTLSTEDKKIKSTSGYNVSYTSSNTDVLTIEDNKITPVSAGTSTITGTYINEDGSEVKGTLNITVSEKDPVIATLTCTTELPLVLPREGNNSTGSGYIQCSAYDQANNRSLYIPENAKLFTFKSSNPKIAKVDDAGNVTAVKQGTTKITVKVKGYSKTATVNVTVASGQPKYDKIIITNNETELAVNETLTINYKLIGAGGESISDPTVKMQLSNKNASKLSDGISIKGKSKGNVVITLSYTNPDGATITSDKKIIDIYKPVTCYRYKTHTFVPEACPDGYVQVGTDGGSCYKILEDITTEYTCMYENNIRKNLRIWSQGQCLDAADQKFPKYEDKLSDYIYGTKKETSAFSDREEVTGCRGNCSVDKCTVQENVNSSSDVDTAE